MGEAISWVAVNKCGEVSLDSDLPPLPRGWERCLDLQSGVMYLKQMQTEPDALKTGGNLKRGATLKRQRVLLGDDEGERDPALQLTLSIRRSDDANQPNRSSLSYADSRGDNGRRASSSQNWMQAAQWGEDVTPASSNGSSSSHNPCSSSASSSPPSKLKPWGANPPHHRDKSLIRAAGCPHCFMYVLPSKSNPKCPRCKSSILVDLSPLTIH